jgi:hypothetical protein
MDVRGAEDRDRSLVKELERCDMEIARCIQGQRDAECIEDKWGALLGEVDWRVERALVLASSCDRELED